MTHLLLADDDRLIQVIAAAVLKRAQFNVSVVSNGVEALAHVASSRPDVILLDCQMPELDGLETCARLKAMPDTRGIPVIFLTAASPEHEVRRGLDLGAIGCIAKPFDASTLATRVREMLDSLDQERRV